MARRVLSHEGSLAELVLCLVLLDRKGDEEQPFPSGCEGRTALLWSLCCVCGIQSMPVAWAHLCLPLQQPRALLWSLETAQGEE